MNYLVIDKITSSGDPFPLPNIFKEKATMNQTKGECKCLGQGKGQYRYNTCLIQLKTRL